MLRVQLPLHKEEWHTWPHKMAQLLSASALRFAKTGNEELGSAVIRPLLRLRIRSFGSSSQIRFTSYRYNSMCESPFCVQMKFMFTINGWLLDNFEDMVTSRGYRTRHYKSHKEKTLKKLDGSWVQRWLFYLPIGHKVSSQIKLLNVYNKKGNNEAINLLFLSSKSSELVRNYTSTLTP